MALDDGAIGPAELELDRMATCAMPCEEKAVLFRKVPQDAPVEATITAFRSRRKACIDVGGKRVSPPLRMSRRRSDLGARALGAAPDRSQGRIRGTY